MLKTKLQSTISQCTAAAADDDDDNGNDDYFDNEHPMVFEKVK